MSLISSARLCSKERIVAAKAKTAKALQAGWTMALMLLFGLRPSVQGAPKAITPAQPVPERVRVLRGTAVEIPLRVYGDPGGGVTFEVRRGPEFGKVSEPQTAGRDSGIIIYQQSDDGTHFADRFSVVAKSNAGVSAPAEITIRIVDPDAVFIAPEELDFGTSRAGDSVSQEFVLENRGGGIVEGRIQCSPGWEVRGEGTYRLGEAEKKSVTIAFKGTEEREYRGFVHYSSHPSRETELRARVEAPLGFSSKIVELKFDRGLRKRIGSFEITDREEQAHAVRIEHGERLVVPEKIDLDGGQKATVKIEVSGNDVDRVDEKLLVISGQYLTEVSVTAPPVGPVLEVDKPMLSFGDVTLQHGSTATLQIENIGGSRAFIRAEAPAPFQIAADDSSFTLEPRARRAVRVAIQPPEVGGFRTTLSFKSGEEELLVPVEARVTGQRATVYAPSAPGSASAVESSLRPTVSDQIDPEAQPFAETAPIVSIPPAIRSVLVRSVAGKSCALAWAALASGTGRYAIERRKSSLSGEELVVKWLPVTEVAFTTKGGEVIAAIRNLEPNSYYNFRVSAVESSGELSQPSFPIEVETPARPPVFTTLRVLSTALVVMLILIWRQRRMEMAAHVPVSKSPPSWRFRF